MTQEDKDQVLAWMETIRDIAKNKKNLKGVAVDSDKALSEIAGIAELAIEEMSEKHSVSIENSIGSQDLESFGEGEIVYAIETQDYFAAIFKIPSNWHGEDYFETEVAINMNGEWVYSKCDSFYLEEEQWYRMATDDEIKMFNEMAKKV